MEYTYTTMIFKGHVDLQQQSCPLADLQQTGSGVDMTFHLMRSTEVNQGAKSCYRNPHWEITFCNVPFANCRPAQATGLPKSGHEN